MKKVIILLGLILVSCSKDGGQDKQTFTLTVSASDGGTVDTAGGTYDEGTTVTVTATPDAEYLFNNWSGTESSTNNPLNIVLTSNENVTANFVKKQYELAITIEGEGTVEEVVTQQGKEYASGTEVELTAVAAEGWVFSSWSEALEGSDNPKNIVIDDNKTVKATFIRKSYELTVNITGEGTVTEEVITAPSQYEFETELRLTAEPSQYWQFVGWSGDIELTDNPITFTIDKTYNLDATFELLDTDGDGYTDDIDQCPDTPAGAVVDENGCQIPEDSLIAWYPFNGNANDESGNGNDGTVVGAFLTTDRHGNENSAYYFGDNCVDRVDANIDTSAIDASKAFSFSIWYYYSGDGCDNPRLFEFWPGSNNLTRFVAGGEYDNLTFIYLGVSGSNTGSSWVSRPNQWTHLVFTVDSSSFAVYQDGELIGSGETDVNIVELPGDVAFGRMNHSGWDGIEGNLDDIRLYDFKLSPSQVQQLFEETF